MHMASMQNTAFAEVDRILPHSRRYFDRSARPDAVTADRRGVTWVDIGRSTVVRVRVDIGPQQAGGNTPYMYGLTCSTCQYFGSSGASCVLEGCRKSERKVGMLCFSQGWMN